MTEQYDSLGEKTRLIENSMRFTGGNIDKAKDMIAGKYNDVVVIKGKFLATGAGKTGVFMAGVNIMENYIGFIEAVIIPDVNSFEKIRIFNSWKTILKEISEFRANPLNTDNTNFPEFLLGAMVSNDVFKETKEDNLDDLVKKINGILSKKFAERIQDRIEIEHSSSLALEQAGIRIAIPGRSDSKSAKKETDSIIDEKMAEIEKTASYVITGEAIVAPVKGKYIHDIQPGEKVMVLLKGKDIVTSKILALLKGKDDEGNLIPVKGRLKNKVYMDKGGCVLYILVARGVLARVIEEENVKIKVEMNEETLPEEKYENPRILYFMGVLVVLILISGYILFQML